MSKNRPFAHRCTARRLSAFTLVELVVVMLIIGILASVAAGRFSDMANDTIVSALQSSLRSIFDKIEMQTAASSGIIPPEIEPTWFREGNLPSHPQNSFGVDPIETYTADARDHPYHKVLRSNVDGAYWYNATTGVVRARVANQGTTAKTIDLYNHVNQSTESGLGNYVSSTGT